MTHRILVVEDNIDNSRLVTWILEDEGFEVACAENGEQCLSLLASGVYDLILMDISLPGISGTETTRRIRQTPAWSAIPILALTAHAFDSERQTILESGVNDLLTKPINDELMLKLIHQHLRG